MTKQAKVKQIEKWYREGKIKRLRNNCFSVPSNAFVLGITPTLVSEVISRIVEGAGEHATDNRGQ